MSRNSTPSSVSICQSEQSISCIDQWDASTHLSCGDDLGEGVVEDGLVGDQVQEVDTVHVERQDVLTALQGIIVTPNLGRESIFESLT